MASTAMTMPLSSTITFLEWCLSLPEMRAERVFSPARPTPDAHRNDDEKTS
jgi:hypothetical protein